MAKSKEEGGGTSSHEALPAARRGVTSLAAAEEAKSFSSEIASPLLDFQIAPLLHETRICVGLEKSEKCLMDPPQYSKDGSCKFNQYTDVSNY